MIDSFAFVVCVFALGFWFSVVSFKSVRQFPLLKCLNRCMRIFLPSRFFSSVGPRSMRDVSKNNFHPAVG